MAETLSLSLRRNHQEEPWGFRLQGGIDFKTPLSVQMVNPGGVADRCGLRPSDAVLSLNGQATETLEHEEAKRIIIMSGMEVAVMIQRGATNVWKPKVTSLADLRTGTPQDPSTYSTDSGEQFVQRTSLAADKQEPIRVGSAHNRAARPFPGFGGPSSVSSGGGGMGAAPGGSQGGAPPGGNVYGGQMGGQGGYQPAGQPQYEGASTGPGMGGYPQDQGMATNAGSTPSNSTNPAVTSTSLLTPHAASSGGTAIPGYRSVSPSFLSAQSGENGTDPAPGAGAGEQKPTGMRSVKAPVFDPSKVAPQIKNHPVCKVCKSQIIGVFVKIMGEPHHPECFKCASCGKNLKNQGYYEDSGQLFCDAHGPAAMQQAY